MSKKLLEPLIISKEEGGEDVKLFEYPSHKKISKRIINDIDGFQEVSFKSQEDAGDVFRRIASRIEKDDNTILIQAKLGDVGKDKDEWDLDELLSGRKDDLTIERALQGRGRIEIIIGRYIPRDREWFQVSMNYRLNIAGNLSGKTFLEIKNEEKKLKPMMIKIEKLLRENKISDAMKEISKIVHLISDPKTQFDIERIFQTDDARHTRLLKWIELVEDFEEDKEDEYRESSRNIQNQLYEFLGLDKVFKMGGFLMKAMNDCMGFDQPFQIGGKQRETRESIIEDFLKRTGRRTIQKRYIPESLTLEDLKKQLKSIEEGTPRPELKSFTSKESQWTTRAKQVFGEKRSKEDIAEHLSRGNTTRKKQILKGLDEIYDRGMKAYETSGSRPNQQTPFSWGQARIYGVLFGSPARNQDSDIVKKYKIPLVSLKKT